MPRPGQIQCTSLCDILIPSNQNNCENCNSSDVVSVTVIIIINNNILVAIVVVTTINIVGISSGLAVVGTCPVLGNDMEGPVRLIEQCDTDLNLKYVVRQ
jgi:hypothetical protein